jgi:outer membrane receptor protein involved in Fe transport
VKLQANVFNVFNQRGILSISPGKTQALDQFTFLAPRSYQISVKADF